VENIILTMLDLESNFGRFLVSGGFRLLMIVNVNMVRWKMMMIRTNSHTSCSQSVHWLGLCLITACHCLPGVQNIPILCFVMLSGHVLHCGFEVVVLCKPWGCKNKLDPFPCRSQIFVRASIRPQNVPSISTKYGM